MLNILEEFDIAEMGFGTADSIHLLLEAMKKAFADRNRYTGDPAYVEGTLRTAPPRCWTL